MILGCTEIPLLVKQVVSALRLPISCASCSLQSDVPEVPLYDTTTIHVSCHATRVARLIGDAKFQALAAVDVQIGAVEIDAFLPKTAQTSKTATATSS